MSWYLKKCNDEDHIYGSVSLTTLRHWAEQGRIEAKDKVSSDKQEWSLAGEISDLAMNWVVELEDGSLRGPLNLLAVSEFIINGSLGFDMHIKHHQSKELKDAGVEVLKQLTESYIELHEIVETKEQVPAVVEQDDKWEQLCVEAQAQKAEVQKELEKLRIEYQQLQQQKEIIPTQTESPKMDVVLSQLEQQTAKITKQAQIYKDLIQSNK